jgi:uncharacterized repeat protein (TIGR04138 family)
MDATTGAIDRPNGAPARTLLNRGFPNEVTMDSDQAHSSRRRRRSIGLVNFRDELAQIIANDPRYSIESYGFILEALNLARHQKLKSKRPDRDQEPPALPPPGAPKRASRSRKSQAAGHVNGPELCEAVRRLALRQFGLLASVVLEQWGVRSTSDIGEIVYNLIAAGDLEKNPEDSREDFENVFEFETALTPESSLAADDDGD